MNSPKPKPGSSPAQNRRWLGVLPGLLGILPLTGSGQPAEKFEDLLRNSPFGAIRNGTSGSPVEQGAPEFRSLMVQDGRSFFSLYDPATQRSAWVELNEPADGLLVKGYDAAHERITITHQGRPLTLSLKRAVVVAQAMAVPVPVAPSASMQPAVAASNHDMSLRQQLVQEEIRRRRALGGKSAAAGNPPALPVKS